MLGKERETGGIGEETQAMKGSKCAPEMEGRLQAQNVAFEEEKTMLETEIASRKSVHSSKQPEHDTITELL